MEDEIDIRELLNIIYKRRVFLILIVSVFVVTGLIISFTMTPLFETTTTIALGKFDNETFNNAEFAKNIILAKENLLSDKRLSEIINQYNAETPRQRLQMFKDSISINAEKDTNILKISVLHNNPKAALEIADLLVRDFKQKSDEMYNQKYKIPKESIEEYQKEILNYESEINKLKKWLSEMNETKGATLEEDLVLTRLRQNLIDYEAQKVDLQEKVDKLQNQMLNYEPASVLEIPIEPKHPVKPNKRLITVVMLISGLVIGHFVVFIVEYFSRNPIRRAGNKDLV